MRKLGHLFCFIILFAAVQAVAQDPQRFSEEIRILGSKYDTIYDSSRESIVFTGSSSIRFWTDLQQLFPSHQIINTGFGGSQTSDLLFFADELILKYQPKTVFIYEGDNDISQAKKPREILKDFRELIRKLETLNPAPNIVVIAAKPSLARWHLKRRYKKFNRKLRRMCNSQENIQFADAWSVMMEDRNIKQDLFIDDGLHMNQKGYALWLELIKPYIN